MYIFQIILILFFLFAIGKVLARFKAKELQLGSMFFWLIFWIAAIVVVAVPNITSSTAKFLGLGRGVDLVVYVSLVVIFFLLFRILVRQEKMERNITILTRKMALDEQAIRK